MVHYDVELHHRMRDSCRAVEEEMSKRSLIKSADWVRWWVTSKEADDLIEEWHGSDVTRLRKMFGELLHYAADQEINIVRIIHDAAQGVKFERDSDDRASIERLRKALEPFSQERQT